MSYVADISGTVPASFSKLNRLALLDLEFNFLWGSLTPQQLCPERNVLQAVYLRGNNFTGSLNLTACRRLEVADIQVRRGDSSSSSSSSGSNSSNSSSSSSSTVNRVRAACGLQDMQQ
jgi:hypothetical protein